MFSRIIYAEITPLDKLLLSQIRDGAWSLEFRAAAFYCM